jgi:hypothetical protein
MNQTRDEEKSGKNQEEPAGSFSMPFTDSYSSAFIGVLLLAICLAFWFNRTKITEKIKKAKEIDKKFMQTNEKITKKIKNKIFSVSGHKKDGTKILDTEQLKKELIYIYETYLDDPNDSEMKAHARKIRRRFKTADVLLNEDMSHAMSFLADIGYDFEKTKPAKAKARQILKKLKSANESH